MRLPYLSILSGLVAFSAITMSAQEAVVTISPKPGTYETLPEKFTLTIEGPTSMKKQTWVSNNIQINSPAEFGENQRGACTQDGTTLTYNVPESYLNKISDIKGDFTVQFVNAAFKYTWPDGSTTTSKVENFTYTITGKGDTPVDPDPVEPDPVVYDIELQKTTPNLNPFDYAEYDTSNTILQLYFSMGDLQLATSNATVTITGPEYNQTTTLQPLMNMPTSTVFKTNFSAPKYSGKYTLTIPQGVLGDAEWINDHQYGHANAEINYEFEVINGISSEEAQVSISPAPGKYDTLPEEFVITVEGPESIKKNPAGPNPLLIISPQGVRQQLSGIFSGNTITCYVPDAYVKDDQGEYKVIYQANAINYIWPGGSKGVSEEIEYTYDVVGVEKEDPNVPKPIEYDVEMIKTIPNLRPLDLELREINTLQLYFNMGNLKLDPKADALVTITGPNYYGSSTLVPGMNMPTATVFNASFNNPKYDGEYTLTISQGILGDEIWINDHTMGHANAEVTYTFTVEGGEDPSTITKDLTFNPRVTPANSSKVSDLSNITLAFNSLPYFDTEAEIEVIYRADLSEDGVDTPFGTAKLTRGEDNNLILSINPTPRSIGQYSLTLPEGIIWNEQHEADEEAGALNSEMPLSWFLSTPQTNLEVTGHIPATDQYVGMFVAGSECIVIMTNVTDEVASADFELIEYKLDDETAAPKTLVDATSTSFNKDGYICWINNTGSDIELMSDCYYEVSYTLYNADGRTLVSDMFEFYGDLSVGVEGITIDANNAKIFNLQGIEVKGDNLPAGIYIKNGKKLIIR